MNVLKEFVEFFPKSGIGKTLSAYLKSEMSPFPAPKPEDGEESEKQEKKEVAEEEYIDTRDYILETMIVCPAH